MDPNEIDRCPACGEESCMHALFQPDDRIDGFEFDVEDDEWDETERV